MPPASAATVTADRAPASRGAENSSSAGLLRDDHADPAVPPPDQVLRGPRAHLRLVHAQRVRTRHSHRSQGYHRARPGPLEGGDVVRGQGDLAEGDHRDGPQLGPGARRLVPAEPEAAVLDDGVVEAAQGPLELVEEGAVERAHRHLRDRQQHDPGVPGTQAPGGGVRDVPEFLGGLPDLAPGRLADTYGFRVVQDVRNRRAGDAGEAGHVGAGRHGDGVAGAGGMLRRCVDFDGLGDLGEFGGFGGFDD
ncbi:hypothetical protein GCM10020254_16060 [Streptomyces goshikiensis]